MPVVFSKLVRRLVSVKHVPTARILKLSISLQTLGHIYRIRNSLVLRRGSQSADIIRGSSMLHMRQKGICLSRCV